jgi:pre-rRNA-processing protein TSR3
MRSSGSTRSRPAEVPVRLFIALVGEDHPKACTGRRLIARGLARPARDGAHRIHRPITLDPHAAHPLSPLDRARVDAAGLLAVDCSWNQLAARGRLPDRPSETGRPAPRRRLPILVAANPQHYGRVTELNTAEALAAAVYLVGRRAQAEGLLNGFRGGDQFLEINRERLDAYAAAADADAVCAVERRLFGGDPPR